MEKIDKLGFIKTKNYSIGTFRKMKVKPQMGKIFINQIIVKDLYPKHI